MTSPPDWSRYVMPGTPGIPVGDSTRWGAQLLQPLNDVVSDVTTPQILQVATNDTYARSWALLGTLSLPAPTWGQADLFVQLEIMMGVGQITIQQAVMLLHPAISTPAPGFSPVGRGGLCLQQNLYQGGPYNALLEVNEGGPTVAFGFAIIGGLIGHSISVRARYQSSNPVTPGFPTISRLAMIVSPYAAGKGL